MKISNLILICMIFLAGCITPPAPTRSVPTLTLTNWSPMNEALLFFTKTTIADIPTECWIEAVSPSAEWIVKSCEPYKDLVVERFDGSESHTLFSASEKSAFQIKFSPDGKKMAAVIVSDSIWLFDVGNWSASQKIYTGQDGHSRVAWAPDSKKMAVTYFGEKQIISVIDIDGKINNLVSYNEVVQAESDHLFNRFGPAWSPDSNQIAYVVLGGFMEDHPIELWAVDIRDRNKKLLYSGKEGEYGLDPIWMNDGKTFLFDTMYRGTDSNFLATLDLESGVFRKIFPYKYVSAFAISPDGRFVVSCTLSNDFTLINLRTFDTQLIITEGSKGERCSTRLLAWLDNDTILSRAGTSLFKVKLENIP